jgi:hypothetical protein
MLSPEALGMQIRQPDLSLQNRPLAPVVLADDPIVRFVMNRREQPKNGVAPGREAGGRRNDGLVDLETVIPHFGLLCSARSALARQRMARTQRLRLAGGVQWRPM